MSHDALAARQASDRLWTTSLVDLAAILLTMFVMLLAVSGQLEEPSPPAPHKAALNDLPKEGARPALLAAASARQELGELGLPDLAVSAVDSEMVIQAGSPAELASVPRHLIERLSRNATYVLLRIGCECLADTERELDRAMALGAELRPAGRQGENFQVELEPGVGGSAGAELRFGFAAD